VASVVLSPQAVGAGASGAVFGVYGALGAFLIRERGAIPFGPLRALRNSAAAFVVYNVVFGFSVAGIDNAAHVGGLIAGGLAGLWLARPLGPRQQSEPSRLVATLVAGVLLAAAVLRVLGMPADVAARLRAFDEVETLCAERYNQLLNRAKAKTLSREDFARQIQAELLPPWREAMAALDNSGPWPAEQARLRDLLLRYAGAREQAWVHMSAALHSDDAAAYARAHEFDTESKRLLDQLNQPGNEPPPQSP
jgi:rhomboid protease GluP